LKFELRWAEFPTAARDWLGFFGVFLPGDDVVYSLTYVLTGTRHHQVRETSFFCTQTVVDTIVVSSFFFSFTFFFFNFFLRYDKTGSPFRLCVGLYTTLYKLLLHTFINLEQRLWSFFSFSSHILQVGFLLMFESGKKIASFLSKNGAPKIRILWLVAVWNSRVDLSECDGL
jgi:hypothetical protein